ncbi:hypothetical protein B0H19DRAFT_1255896 [Mycena capillaripes]|nr:hypothetical protein B0H19DRAFT_1255896 [Mycena capillaripes]
MVLFRGRWTWLTLTLIFCNIPFLLANARLGKRRAKLGRSDDPLGDSGLRSASWIWTSGATTGNVAFVKTYISGSGRTATTATISMTVVTQFTLWVNGQQIGASGDEADDWKSAKVFTTTLNPTSNIFSVLAVNNADSGAPAPGLLAGIVVNYGDGSDDVIISDSFWEVSTVIPSGFPTPSDWSVFSWATILAPFGSGSWGNSVTLASSSPSLHPVSPPSSTVSTSTSATVNAPSPSTLSSSSASRSRLTASSTRASTHSSSSTTPPTNSTSRVSPTTLHSSSTFHSISVGTGSTNNLASSSSPVGVSSSSRPIKHTATSSAHAIPVGLIVGPVVGGLALLVALALLYWRHRRSRQQTIHPFRHLRPAMVQAGHPQPYPQPRSGSPQSQGIIPPTKLERTTLTSLNSPSALGAVNTNDSVGIVVGSPSQGAVTPNADANSNETSQPNPVDDAPEHHDSETLPSYHAQV